MVPVDVTIHEYWCIDHVCPSPTFWKIFCRHKPGTGKPQNHCISQLWCSLGLMLTDILTIGLPCTLERKYIGSVTTSWLGNLPESGVIDLFKVHKWCHNNPGGEMIIGQLLRQGPRICKSPESAELVSHQHFFIPNLNLGWLALGNLHKTTIFSDSIWRPTRGWLQLKPLQACEHCGVFSAE